MKNISSEDYSNKITILRIGGSLACLGGFFYFITLLFHGDLPDKTTEVALEHIASRPEWKIMKLILIFSALSWVFAFESFQRTVSNSISALFSRFAVISSIVGIAIIVVEYSMIGFALKEVADKWVEASGSQSETFSELAGIILTLSRGLFHSFIMFLIGLPFLLMGAAVFISKEYPSWFGGIALMLGSGILIAGILRYLGIELIPYGLLYGGGIIPTLFWLIGLGIYLISKAKKL